MNTTTIREHFDAAEYYYKKRQSTEWEKELFILIEQYALLQYQYGYYDGKMESIVEYVR